MELFSSVVIAVIASLAGGILTYYSYKNKNYIAAAIGAVQILALVLFAALTGSITELHALFLFDHLALIIILITGIMSAIIMWNKGIDYFIIGSALAIDGMAVSNNLMLMFMFWQLLALASYKLIASDGAHALECGKRMLVVNATGSLFFVTGIIVSGIIFETVDISVLALLETRYADLVAGPVVFIVLAGMARCVQMPFQGWYFHECKLSVAAGSVIQSVTLLNSGALLLIKMSPFMGTSNFAGLLAIIGGGVTFFIASLNAITEIDLRRMLADATSSIMGLVVICAGIGTSESIWSAIMLIIFNAVAKPILIAATEDKHLRPDTVMASMAMMTAPFVIVLLQKEAMRSIVDTGNIILLLIISFSGAISVFYWTRWFGTMISDAMVSGIEPLNLKQINPARVNAWLLTAVVVTIPLISRFLVIPYIEGILGGMSAATSLTDNIVATLIIVAAVGLAAYPVHKGIKAKSQEDIQLQPDEDEEETHEMIRKSKSTVRAQLICSIVSIAVIVLCVGFVSIKLAGLIGGAL